MARSESINPARAVAAAVALGTLAACAAPGGGHSGATIPAGSAVVLDRTLQMPAGSARAYIQGGRVIDEGDINRFVAACSFGLRRQGGEALVGEIRPGRFDTGRSRTRGHTRRAPDDALRVATRGWPLLAQSERRGGLAHLTFTTEIPLSAPDQPQVDDLTCRYDAEPDKGPLTLEQIRSALGDIASIRLAGG